MDQVEGLAEYFGPIANEKIKQMDGLDTTMPEPDVLVQEGKESLSEFLRKNGKSTWGDLTMAGKTSAAFFVAKKILSKHTDGMDDFKWAAKND
jgi:hypothetical protein